MARLVLLSEGFTGKTYELKAESTTVGRVDDNTFEIPDPSISSHHCEILLRGSDVVVKDLGSTNGTFINGEKISESALKPGQILRLGMVEMRLETGQAGQRSKEVLDHTRVIPQGVNKDDLQSGRPISLEDSKVFEKKSNKATRIFILLAIVVGICLVAVLLAIVFK